MSDGVTVVHGDCLDVLRTLPDASVDAVCTDPPYELGFMGKGWDASGIAYSVDLWMECLRVLKPGGHLLAFGGTRTFHRMACAVEDAGFELRDSIQWIYSQGFPKSHAVDKDIDRMLGATRETKQIRAGGANAWKVEHGGQARHWMADVAAEYGVGAMVEVNGDAPATDAARQWSGWGTALKPASEPIIVARKPLAEKSVAANVLKHGAGGVNVDACRVVAGTAAAGGGDWVAHTAGRWPANVILSHSPSCAERCGDGCPVAELGAQSEGASRFFPVFRYQAKAPTKERPKVDGIAHPTVKPLALMRWLVRLVTLPGGTVLDPFAGSGTTGEAAALEGFEAILVEREAAYLPLIAARLARLDGDAA